MPLQDRILGCLVGGAISDILGGVPERGDLSLSDDTQLTLATCEALLGGQVLPDRSAAAFVRWFRSGAITGMGSSTLKALRDLSAGAHWALSGARGEMAAGNGAAGFSNLPRDLVALAPVQEILGLAGAFAGSFFA